MRTKRSIARPLGAALLAALAAAAPGAASTTQETIIQDDPLLLGAESQSDVDAAFESFRAIGIDRVRVSLFWDHIAPGRTSQSKPTFPGEGPASPASYPPEGWELYDRMVLAAARTGVGLLLSVTGPGPAWATPGRRCDRAGPFQGCQEGVFRPDPREFADFVLAAGIRYSGSYRVEEQGAEPPPREEPTTVGPVELPDPGGDSDDEQAEPEPEPADPLPRVDHWSVWNEPNYPAWLLPIWEDNDPRRKRDMVAAAPHHYRALVDAAYAGLTGSGHGDDTILIGETSPRGGKKPTSLGNAMMPAEFARELYCLDGRRRAYRGAAARERDCPATAAERRRFTADHPGLFRAQGWAHHPYSLARRRWRLPTWRHPLRDNVPIANLGHLLRTLDHAAGVWGSASRKSIWITEYGYQTSPPDPVAGVAPGRQGPLSAWGEYLAYRNPRVASTAQFLLYDDAPIAGYKGDDPRRWVSWQSGLFTAEREPKPFFDDFRLPLHVARRGRSVRVFGTLRPAATGAPLEARIEFAPPGGGWTMLRELGVENPRGYLSERVTVPGPGSVRISWLDPAVGEHFPTRARSVGRQSGH